LVSLVAGTAYGLFYIYPRGGVGAVQISSKWGAILEGIVEAAVVIGIGAYVVGLGIAMIVDGMSGNRRRKKSR
jgi:uncharacterized protein (DUF2062 family)